MYLDADTPNEVDGTEPRKSTDDTRKSTDDARKSTDDARKSTDDALHVSSAKSDIKQSKLQSVLKVY